MSLLGRLARRTAIGDAVQAVGTGYVAPGPLRAVTPDYSGHHPLGAGEGSADMLPEPYGPDPIVFGPRVGGTPWPAPVVIEPERPAP